MAKRLAVILGAGASFDSIRRSRTVGVSWSWRPPLTTELFEPKDESFSREVQEARRRNFETVLARYPRARSLASELGIRAARGEGLEAVLRSWRDGEDYIVRRFQQVPFYIQDLLSEVGQNLLEPGTSADNYDVLVSRLLSSEFEQVAFISLNYDLLLEKSLVTAGDTSNAVRTRLGLRWYTEASHKWLYVKLHGSVDWAQRIISEKFAGNDTSHVMQELDERPLIRDFNFGNVELLANPQMRVVDGMICYPRLAIPVDDEYATVCPTPHLQAVSQFLKTCKNLLVIGARAKDNDLLELLGRAEMTCEGLGIVTGTPAGADETLGCVKEAVTLNTSTPLISTNGFNQFIITDELESFISSIS